MTEETNNSGPQRPDLSVIRGQLRDAGQPDQRTRIDTGNADLEAMMRVMTPVMAKSEIFFNFSGGLYIINTIEAPPRLTTYGEEDEQVVIEPIKITAPVPVDKHLLQVVICNCFTFFRNNSDGVQFDCKPPLGLCSNIVALKGRGMPPLASVADYPVLGPKREILTTSNAYDPRMAVYFADQKKLNLKVYTDPHEAYRFLRYDWLGEFDFKEEGDFWRCISYMLSLLSRKTMCKDAGGNPFYIFVAQLSSSGKTALAKALYAAVVGRRLPISPSDFGDETEFKKNLFAIFLSSTPAVLFDNVARGHKVRSSNLEAATSSDEFEDRVLGVSRRASASALTVLAASGNNIEAGGDMPNRTLTIRLSPTTQTPQLRRFDKELHGWTLDHREEILGALQCFVKLSRKREDEPNGRFPVWNNVVGAPIIAAAKINGYKGDVFAEWQEQAEGEGTKDAEIDAVCEALLKFGDEWRRTSDLKSMIPDELDALFGTGKVNYDGEENMGVSEMTPASVGNRLKVFSDYVTDRFKFVAEKRPDPNTRKKVKMYKVLKLSERPKG